ncbi:unnamed protein product [Haemonchus placei]|uniref:Innexin n=1 Tax=Haemonchus placei TaxID=6290 RepID=A0A0N4WBY8_HAEPC|nr:unnamed protein product [Haemonchus placei]
MLSLPSIFDILSKVDNYPAEDFIDRLNFGASVYLLAFFVLITGSKQHFGNPIQCMAPPESPGTFQCVPLNSVERKRVPLFVDSWVHYYHDYCYIQDKLRIFNMNVDKSLAFDIEAKQSGCRVDLETAIVEAQKLRTLVGDDRAAALNNLANFIRDVLEAKRRRSVFGSSMASICYSITKWLEVINGFGQLYMLTYFVGEGDYLWGIHALANLHQVNMQCVLMLNFINEKIYTFLWFWIVFVTFASFLSAIRQMVALLFPVYRSLIADNFLPTQDVLFSNALAEHGVRPTPVTSRALVDYFIHKILRCDGVLLLSFINGNVGGLVTHDIAHQLWKITVQPSFNLRASPGSSRRRFANIYPGVPLAESRHTK